MIKKTLIQLAVFLALLVPVLSMLIYSDAIIYAIGVLHLIIMIVAYLAIMIIIFFNLNLDVELSIDYVKQKRQYVSLYR